MEIDISKFTPLIQQQIPLALQGMQAAETPDVVLIANGADSASGMLTGVRFLGTLTPNSLLTVLASITQAVATALIEQGGGRFTPKEAISVTAGACAFGLREGNMERLVSPAQKMPAQVIDFVAERLKRIQADSKNGPQPPPSVA